MTLPSRNLRMVMMPITGRLCLADAMTLMQKKYDLKQLIEVWLEFLAFAMETRPPVSRPSLLTHAHTLFLSGMFRLVFRPQFSTLTGACAVALGEHAAGLFSDNADLVAALEQSGLRTGDRVWRMPVC